MLVSMNLCMMIGRKDKQWMGLFFKSVVDRIRHSPMDSERQKWLEKALREMSTDEIELMKKALKVHIAIGSLIIYCILFCAGTTFIARVNVGFDPRSWSLYSI